MVKFHETRTGRVFLERTLPELVRAIERLAAAVEALAEEQKTEATGANTTQQPDAC